MYLMKLMQMNVEGLTGLVCSLEEVSLKSIIRSRGQRARPT